MQKPVYQIMKRAEIPPDSLFNFPGPLLSPMGVISKMYIEEKWLDKFCLLNVAKTNERGLAPHKPILLLCIMDMIEDRSLITPWVQYSPELFFRFQGYWEIVFERQKNRPDMEMPFHALGGNRDQIWSRYQENGQQSRAKQTTRLCHIDDSLWKCFQDDDFRNKARIRLISRYFIPPEQIAICSKLKLPEPSSEEIAEFHKSAEAYKASVKKGRDSRFRNDVLIKYKFTCALTGYSLNTEKENLVEAAHIYQHSLSGNDDPKNGLALTPDAHWMFDHGLWTVIENKSDLIVLIAQDRFIDSSPLGRTLQYHHEKSLFFAKDSTLRPDVKYFAWHRKNKFLG